MIKKDTLTRLKVLDREVLAQALFDLTEQSDDAQAVVDRLTRTSDESYKSTKRSIAALKRSSRYIQWSEVPAFVRKLENLVEDINQIAISAEQRFNLICSFFETDQATFDRVDDSSGNVGDVYRNSALTVFGESVANLATTNQSVIADELVRLISKNDYCVRDDLVDAAVVHLDDSTIRDLVARFSERSDREPDSYLSVGWLRYVLAMAVQLGDTRLFEITALESVANLDNDEVPTNTKLLIASNYFKNSEFEKAKCWMDEIGPSERSHQSERNQLLVALHDKLGNPEERDRIAREQFKCSPSKDALETLIL